MMLRWPSVGLFSLTVLAIYIASNIFLTTWLAKPLNAVQVALDSRIGGALADSISPNPTVKSFGAEAREEARIGAITRAWSRAALKAWNRYMDLWLWHNMLLVGLQAGLTGLLVRLWSRGEATAGDVAFAITSFVLMSGYLRNIGEGIRTLQKGLNDVEDAAGYARTPAQVADVAGAPAFRPELGLVVFDHVTFGYGAGIEPLYRDFNLVVAPGERVALVGPTGAG